MPKYRRTYTVDFKLQILNLVKQGESRKNICREYDLRKSTLNNWISNYRKIESNSALYNQNKDKVANYLRGEIVRLREEVEILNQAVLILSRK